MNCDQYEAKQRIANIINDEFENLMPSCRSSTGWQEDHFNIHLMRGPTDLLSLDQVNEMLHIDVRTATTTLSDKFDIKILLMVSRYYEQENLDDDMWIKEAAIKLLKK